MSSYLDFNGLKRYHENSKEYVDSKIPTKTSALTNDSGYVTDENLNSTLTDYAKSTDVPSIDGLATEAYVDEQIANLVDSAPDTMNTLNELATAISDNESVVEALDSAITNKVDKEEGKGLFSGSYNDLTNKPTIPSKVSELTNDSGYAIDDDVQAKFDIRNLKTYVNVIQLGLSPDTATYDDVLNALPDVAELMIYVTQSGYPNMTLPQNSWFMLRICKSWRTIMTLYDCASGDIYIMGTSGSANGTITASGEWTKIATETDLENLVNSNSTTLADLGVTATATELNYVDGVTSNIQTQLDGKASTSVSTTSKNGLMSSTDKTKLDNTNIAYATCSTTADTAAKVATITGNSNWTLKVGSIVVVKFTVTNTASNVTLNVNSTGAKSIWYNNAVYTGNSSNVGGYANRYVTFMYDGTYWVWVSHGTDSNTTYSNASLGQGYGTCSTAEATTAKVVSLSNYALTTGGIVAVKFTYAVPASATMNINSKGAKAIYNRGAAIAANVIKAGDIATFIYNGSQYHLLTVDRDNNSDTKNTTGTTNKTATKLFLAGATSQGSNPVTYSNSGVYIGTDNCLYSNSKKVTTTTYSTTAPSVREVGTVWIG